jgi:Peptidase A4 family
MGKLGAIQACSAVAGTIAVVVLAVAATGKGDGAVAGANIFSVHRASGATDVSSNWAGHVVTAPGTTFTSVTATWKQPTVDCDVSGAGSSSAFWVGLGGYASSSEALEQIGTSADCDSQTGKPTYYAWYELVPNPSIKIKTLKVMPGDRITTSVNIVAADTVLVQLKNRTRKTSFTKKLTFSNPDLSSAEWIAEAPSLCTSFRCRTVPLSDFGSVQFTRIAAIGSGIGGTLTANPGWTTTAVTLVADARRGFFPGPQTFAGANTSTAGASPAAATTDGRSFTVQWAADETSTS